MRAVDIYYKNQATARDLDSVEKVAAISPMVDRIYDSLILPCLPKDKDAVIYEVACGPGLVLSWLARRGYAQVSGTDFCEAYVDIAKKAGLNACVKDSLEDLRQKPDASVDVIFAIDFIEHLPKDSFIEFIYDTRRVLKPGGVLVLREPNADSPLLGRNFFNDITHFWAYTSVSLRAISKIAGFANAKFIDEAIAAPSRHMLWVMPISWVARRLFRLVWALISRERIDYWSPNLFCILTR